MFKCKTLVIKKIKKWSLSIFSWNESNDFPAKFIHQSNVKIV